MNQFCERKCIKRQFSVARTPQQNGVAERKNRTLIEAARTMLVDSKLPTTFWAEAVNTACYVQNRVLVTKPHNKTPYELFLGKFDGKADEGFFVGYSINSKEFRVFNNRTRIVEENLHVQFSKNTPNIAGRNQSNGNASTKACDDACKARMKTVPGKDYILLPSWTADSPFSQKKDDNVNSINNVNAASTNEVNAVGGKTSIELPDDPNMLALEDIVYLDDNEDVGAEKEDGIFIRQDKYVTEILKKFSFIDVKTTSTPMETQKLLLKDEDCEEVDVHLYRSMIGSLMYLTSSRPDIMFAVCACAGYQVNPKVLHLHVVKRIFRYLKGQLKLGLWYPKDSPFDLVAYTDSDYARESLDRKSTTGGCQFLRSRLISWQCKKQNVVANSTIEAEYVAASSFRG
ncbi:uncharacterized mitochondrial protein-like protein [Tanacetum coccineum]|uniref:Uncharacterized mitochondrial protein-like protein n=1 Tax=Tanacetum coccineum TaxID=301880 RepID=A0ABQ4XC16_9ASTR